MTARLSNISIKTLRDYLQRKGLKCYRINSGHEIWGCAGLKRPIVFQTHVDPVPEFIILQILRTLNADKEDFMTFLKE